MNIECSRCGHKDTHEDGTERNATISMCAYCQGKPEEALRRPKRQRATPSIALARILASRPHSLR